MGRKRKKSGSGPAEPATPASGPARGLVVVLAGLLTVAMGVVVMYSSSPAPSEEFPELARGALADWNVVVVTLDTVRADHLGCYGHTDALTPTIDGLARRGLRFEHAIAPTPMTLPSHSSLFTGLDPPGHGVRNNGTYSLAEEQLTLAEILHGAGYRTAAFVGAYVLDARYGLAQGFEHYDDDCNPDGVVYRGTGFNERSADQVTRSAMRWLKQQRGNERFFAWVHYFDAHHPYAPPPAYAMSATPYDGEIAFVDAQLARLLGAIGPERLERTLIIVTADHGEGLGDHGEAAHSYLIYDATVRVPLIMVAPGVLPPTVVGDRIAGLIDVRPSVLHALGIASPTPTHGINLWTAPADAGRAVYIETMASLLNNGWAPLFGLRRLHDKYIQAPRREYYDLGADPGELHNLIGQAVGANELSTALAARLAGWPTPAAVSAVAEPLDAEAIERLAALGYVSTPSSGHIGQRDPKDMIRVWDQVMRAEDLSSSGRHAEAVHTIESALAADGDNGRAWYTATLIHRRMKQFDKAEECVRRALALSPRVEGWVNLAQFMLMRNASDTDIEDALTRAAALDADNGGIYITRGDRLATAGDFSAALVQFEEALKRDPVKYGPVARQKISAARSALGP